jgi:hypothetical protein
LFNFTFRECNSQPNNETNSQQSIANPIHNSNSISNEAGEHYRSNQTMLSNINSNRIRADGSLGISDQTTSYFSNNLDNHQLDQQQLGHRTNESNTSNSKGKIL